MRWEETVFALFDDLEMQAEGHFLESRAMEVEALREAAYAEVSLVSRLHASYGTQVRVALGEGTVLGGRLARTGADWILLDGGTQEWLVPLGAVSDIDGLAVASAPEGLWPLTATLSMGSALRRIAAGDAGCVLWLRGGRQLSGSLARIGADFVELNSAQAVLVVPVSALVAVQGVR